MRVTPMELVYKSDLIYDVANRTFYKSRFGANSTNNAKHLPDTLKPLFNAKISVSANNHIDVLQSMHNKQNLLEALYLTDKYGQYHEHFDMMEYQLVRYDMEKMFHMNILRVLKKSFQNI